MATRKLRLNGQTADQWAKEYFSASKCDACGKGRKHHFISPNGTGGWFARCLEQPRCTKFDVVWRIDLSDYGECLPGYDPDVLHLYCKAIATVQYNVPDAASPGEYSGRIESFESSGLYGIAAPEEETELFRDNQKEVERDKVAELVFHLAHFNVDMESVYNSACNKRVHQQWLDGI
ncbi:MAG: hypothetical protein ACW99G_11615 [Candidatus Thorarchaeota archaeon]|jgi:hypothetical protein